MEKKKKIPTYEEFMEMLAASRAEFEAELKASRANFEAELKASRAEAEKRWAEAEKRWAAEDKRHAEWKAEAEKRQAEEDKRLAELKAEAEKRQDEEDKRLAELKAETEKRRAEAEMWRTESEKIRAAEDKRHAEWKAQWDKDMFKLRKEVSGISSNNGFYAEEFFQRAFSENCELAGIKFDGIIPNLRYSGKENCEFDILLVNGDTVAIIEAKYRIHPDYVEELVAKKLPHFRKYFPIYKNHAVYLGIAGMSFSQDVVDNAKKHGIAVVRQDGKKAVVDSLPTKVY